MKKLIIIEYLSAQTSIKQKQLNSNLSEGLEMVDEFSKKISDLKKEKYEIFILRNKNLIKNNSKNIKYLPIYGNKTWLQVLKTFDTNSFKVLLIAPETDRIFIISSEKIKKLGFSLLNTSLSDIRTFSSKTKTFLKLNKLKIPCVESYSSLKQIKDENKPIVVKPDYGAGSENIFFYRNLLHLKKNKENLNSKTIYQYFNSELIGSFCILCFRGKNILISCNEQIIEKKNNIIKQVGINVGKFEKFRKIFKFFANKISLNFPELYGFIGIDVVLENKCWKILEINPRLTSSFTAIGKFYDIKTMNLILDFYIEEKFDREYKPVIKKPQKFFFGINKTYEK